MFTEKKYSFPIIEFALAFIVYIFHYTSLIDISIYTASPFILLPLCVAVSIFRGEVTGLIFGAVLGAACDACASHTSIFNSVVLMLTGYLAGMLAKNIFNKNFKGTLLLSLIFSSLYFALKWIIFYLIPDVEGKVYYLLWHLFPCALYTAVFIFPFFYLEKWVLKEKKPKNKLYIK